MYLIFSSLFIELTYSKITILQISSTVHKAASRVGFEYVPATFTCLGNNSQNCFRVLVPLSAQVGGTKRELQEF